MHNSKHSFSYLVQLLMEEPALAGFPPNAVKQNTRGFPRRPASAFGVSEIVRPSSSILRETFATASWRSAGFTHDTTFADLSFADFELGFDQHQHLRSRREQRRQHREQSWLPDEGDIHRHQFRAHPILSKPQIRAIRLLQ